MEPKVVTRNEKKIIGIAIRTSNQLEAHQSTAKISQAWQRFRDEKVLEHIPNKAYDNVILAVYTDYESDQNGKYTLIIGTEVTSLEDIPEGMQGMIAPPVKYVELNVEGVIPDIVIETWQQIWKDFSGSRDYQRTFTKDFEVYDLNHPNKVDFYIAVE